MSWRLRRANPRDAGMQKAVERVAGAGPLEGACRRFDVSEGQEGDGDPSRKKKTAQRPRKRRVRFNEGKAGRQWRKRAG